MARKYEGIFIPPEKKGEVPLFIHGTRHSLAAGDVVIDITAEENGWPDVKGEVVAVDGSNVKVRYESGSERWKMFVNLRKEN